MTNNLNIKFHIVLLASGFSRRFRENKLLYKYNGKPMFEYTLDLFKELYTNRKDILSVQVVTGYTDILYDAIHNKRFNAVINQSPEKGISSSMQVGLAKVLSNIFKAGENEIVDIDEEILKQHAFLFSVCDMPNIKKKTINAMINTYKKTDCSIMMAGTKERAGNPVIFNGKYAIDLLKLTGDVGGKQIINKYKDETKVFIVRDENELKDIDYRL